MITFSCQQEQTDLPYFLMASEPTESSVIISARVNQTDSLNNYDIQGMPAEILIILTDDTTSKLHHLDPLIAAPGNDFLVRHKFSDLLNDTEYFYKIQYIVEENLRGESDWQSFKTLPGKKTENLSFVMVTGMNFYRFSAGIDQYGNQKTSQGIVKEGFPGLVTILEQQPSFFIGNGDNVYYDHPRDSSARNIDDMRKFWHRLFHMENMKSMLSEVPVYWMKDDHDYRYNDADTMKMDQNGKILLPSHIDGIKVFAEQAPFSEKPFNEALPYRTYRLTEDLQIWMVEGRDFRSPNKMKDGPAKSIWGKEQLAWLKSTLESSDAKYKLLVSPTPLVGPDDAYKIDNHTNPDGFRHERDEFIVWLKDKNLIENGFYVLCGDRHWQYHAIHPTGLEEFSCGALVDANSRLGRLPGDPESTDPEGLIKQPYNQEEASGGFLEVSNIFEGESSVLEFRFYDESGTLLYETKK